MSDLMTESITEPVVAFQHQIQRIPQVAGLLDQVVEDAQLEETLSGVKSFEPISTGLATVAIAALWKLVNIGLDRVRQLNDEAAAKRRIEIIAKLREEGYERQAPLIVDQLFKEIRQRPADDQVLQTLLKLPQA